MNNYQPKRRSVFIQKGFQGRFILTAFAIILLSGLFSALLIYWIAGDDLRAQSQSVHVNIVNTWERLGISIMIGNLVSVVLAGAVAVVSVLYASHKIAGPLYRFETLCREVGDGNLDAATHLRANDELQQLAKSFSDMVDKLRDNREGQARQLADINQSLSALAVSDNLTTEQRNILAEVSERLAGLNRGEADTSAGNRGKGA
ncbi:HAMP domain-containing protein [Methylomonas sp. LL1]|uniref:HAMP domain-containing protein n=1 Tax=Methylomonas sp. LL1 TaxID=2785785 RepID=UPI0018C3FE23|nr:HAMP domain-containing protein [Methylomonas sp. LL1]QPK63915.1 HAMP domain-containing protein [Methylomonas sp. LL1]